MGWDAPKCLLPCPGGTLLDHALNCIRTCSIERAVLVVGYQQSVVMDAARRSTPSCSFVTNPDYASTNTIHSLYLARDHLTDDCLYLNGDVWFTKTALGTLCASPMDDDAQLLVARKPCGAEEVKVTSDDTPRVHSIGKDIAPDRAAGEFVGVARFSPSFASAMARRLVEYNEVRKQTNLFFEAAVSDLLSDWTVRAVYIDPRDAFEIDTPEDYAAAKQVWSS